MSNHERVIYLCVTKPRPVNLQGKGRIPGPNDPPDGSQGILGRRRIKQNDHAGQRQADGCNTRGRMVKVHEEETRRSEISM